MLFTERCHRALPVLSKAVRYRSSAEAQSAAGLGAGVYKFPTQMKVAPDLLGGSDQHGRRGMGMARTNVSEGEGENTIDGDQVVLDVMLGLISDGSQGQLNATEAARIVDSWRQSLWGVQDEQTQESLGRYVHDIRVASPRKIAVAVEGEAAGRVSLWLAGSHQGTLRSAKSMQVALR